MRLYAAAAICILVLVAISPPAIASEQGSTGIWRGMWKGEDLTVAVVARGHMIDEELRRSAPWWQWGNTTSDAYLFYWSDDEMVDLILDFTIEDGLSNARLYVPRTAELRSAVKLFDGEYTLPEGLTPDLTVTPIEGEWLIDGLPNFDLRILEAHATTGEPSWEIRVGAEAPGLPEWSTRNSIPDDDQDEGEPPFGATIRMDPAVPFELADPLLPSWPYLSAVREEGHWAKIQPIYFSYRQRTLTQNWTGFHIAGMYQINSLTRPPHTNFESPFAFYRFDPDAERRANLVVRSDIWPAGDPHGPSPQYEQRTAVRMTWTGETPELWRYSLSVTGNHSHQDRVEIGDTVIQAVPYDEYPSWIVTRAWKGATFVEATDGETGSEGIYDYSVEDNYAVTEWVNGLLSEPPRDVDFDQLNTDALDLDQLEHQPVATLHTPYTEFPTVHPLRLKEGFRGEYSLSYNEIPRLYMSPIDNRPHLLHAAEGLWNLGDGSLLRVYNLNQDPHLDAWVLEELPEEESELIDNVSLAAPGTVKQALYAFDDFLLFSSSSEVRIWSLDHQVKNKLLPVPRDESSWRRFLDSAESEELDERDPHDLSSWPESLAADALTISRAEATEVRITENGFRFVLELPRGYQLNGTDPLGLEGLESGEYIVAYNVDADDFSVEPLTPALISATLAATSAIEHQPVQLTVELSNDGLQDATATNLKISAKSEHGEVTSIGPVQVELTGHSSATVLLEWSPPGPGDWTLTPTVVYRDEEPITFHSTVVAVHSGVDARPFKLLTISTTGASRILVVLGLGLFVGMAGLVWAVSSDAARNRKRRDER